ncbi:MAG TPA: class I SAM-dependent methyltransferase [Kofleriaceae bacterium]|nr:class I SAM-dependent methyltransferase [Kofleriaceae bacterium]
MPSETWTATRYRRRDEPAYPHQPNSAFQKQWQPDVYIGARALAARLGAARVVDIGCGNGAKLIELAADVPTIGIDFGANFDRARERAPGLDWRAHDLASAEPLPVSPEELRGAVVINADVIEHLPDPSPLLGKLRWAHEHAQLVLVSTPERHLTRGLRDGGPPSNPAHIQEWTTREFGALLRGAGMPIHSVGLIRSHDRSDRVATIFVAIAASHELLRTVDEVLIDLEVPAARAHPVVEVLLRPFR